ncbi:TniQ family protein [Kitasatospora mediocidica]|uniref:TniQ family protein n=1 Tax=Kitasatospora mediocidica TaxID=58352 RepID=UPI0018DB0164|nr:TniQ family protein [Kitasatospora mediocidica]
MARHDATELPCSLNPLPDETLAGLLLRLSHRNEQSPQRIAYLSGLLAHGGRARTLSPRLLLELRPPATRLLAASWRLSLEEASQLTLRSAAPNYPPLHSPFLGRRRDISAMVKDGWALIRYSRYCPQCLAGDGSSIQRDHGGSWQRTWRLPMTFACLRQLRVLIVLIAATWPAIRAVAPHFARFADVEEYLERQHTLLETRAEPSNASRGERFVTALPTKVSTCAALLTLADTLTASGEADRVIGDLAHRGALRSAVRPRLASHVPFCSPGLRGALARLPQMHRSRRPGGAGDFPQEATHLGLYKPRQVPQRLPDTWLVELGELNGISPLELQRDAAIRLVQMARSSSRVQAGLYLGLSHVLSRAGGARIAGWLRTSGQEYQYRQALARIAEHIVSDGHPVDYERRRELLHGWTIPGADWEAIVTAIRQRQRAQSRERTRWDASRHLGASTYIWARATSSEPRLHADLKGAEHRPRGMDPLAHAWYTEHAGRSERYISPTYVHLRELLDSCLQGVIASIDGP